MPITPKPICRQFATESRCSCRGCSDRPSSKTSFRASTAIATAFSKESKSNCLFFTNSERLIEPSKQDPPAGSGSSAR